MKNVVIANFAAYPAKVQELRKLFEQELGATRDFEGCISLEVYFNEDESTFTLIEDWESFENYDRYLEWRVETGIEEVLDPLLVGGWGKGFTISKLQPTGL